MAERGGQRRNGTGDHPSGPEVVQRVRRDLPSLLGRRVESVLGLGRDGNHGWKVTVEVVELSRIPHSTDVLACYEVAVDRDGELQSYHRQRRYHRNQADED